MAALPDPVQKQSPLDENPDLMYSRTPEIDSKWKSRTPARRFGNFLVTYGQWTHLVALLGPIRMEFILVGRRR